jgi:hypothetical protein
MDRRTWQVAADIQKERLVWAERERLAHLANERTKTQGRLAALLQRFSGRLGNPKVANVKSKARTIPRSKETNSI